MFDIIKAEFIKEKRSVNSKLLYIVPIIYVIFNILMVGLMGKAPEGKSYLVAVSFNRYPILILPIIISLLVINICNKEKEEHTSMQKSMGVNRGRLLIAKNLIVLIELLVILLLSSILIYLVGVFILRENIEFRLLLHATIIMFIGSLPIVGVSFLLNEIFNRIFVVILTNFILSFPGPILAVTDNRKFYPRSYSLRMLAPIAFIHPNGTFLEEGGKLLDMGVVPVGILLSIVAYIFFVVLSILKARRKING